MRPRPKPTYCSVFGMNRDHDAQKTAAGFVQENRGQKAYDGPVHQRLPSQRARADVSLRKVMGPATRVGHQSIDGMVR